MKLKSLALTLALGASLLGLASCGTKKSTTSTTVTPTEIVDDNNNSGDNQNNTGDNQDNNNSSNNSSSNNENNNTNNQNNNSSNNNQTTNNGASEGSLDAGSGTVLNQGSLNITSCSGESESAYAEFTPYSTYTDYNVYISQKDANDYKKLTQNKDFYVQTLSQTKTRIDMIGIKGGNYDIKISAAKDGNDMGNPSSFSANIVAYDRSGYAHFNYNEGVGAYNDDGTLKDDAIVLYVTDENKNSVELSYKGKTVAGIGNILNTVGKACGEAGHETQCKKVDEGKINYAAGNTNQGILADLATDNIPLAIRFVGIVSESGLYETKTFDATSEGLIDGLTAYANSSTVNQDGTKASENNDLADYGGTKGDNGHMARMKSAKNVTIEGIGNNACLDGWGIHFMTENAYPELGKSFEVRNLAFMNTPEDAIGMEGQATSKKITASVERCWIHNNTFLAPSISNPAESDKNEGDGSCDFKRGMYYTLSYNYFEYCHKTNLIGSSDSSLQFNMTFHHNLWYNCGSRIPLLRQANIHFYNNYVYGDSSDKKSALSYVTSLRANSYMYAENNFYEGCKNVFEDTGGTAKLYGNEFVQCFGTQTGKIVSSREESVAGNCAYDGTTLQNFDTNSSLFYYNSTKKQSDCYLTTAAVARQEVIKYAGSNYRTKLEKTTLGTNPAFNTETPTEGVTIGDNILPTSKNNGTVNGVVWSGITGYDSTNGVKARGKFATFKVTKAVTMTIEMTASSSQAYNAGSVVKEDGTVVLNGSGTVVLTPGIYTIVSCQKDKDTYVTKLSFTEYDSTELKAQLIENYNTAYSNIPSSITYSDAAYQTIKAAVDAYEALGEYKSEVSTTPYTAYNEYKAAGESYVYNLINQIGTVTKNSGEAISSARSAYDSLISKISDASVSNYETLVNAEKAFETFAVQATIDAINDIGTVTVESGNKIVYAESLYNSLDENQKASVTNYSTLTSARQTYNSLLEVENVIDLIDVATVSTPSTIEDALNAYNQLSDTQKASVTNYASLKAMLKDYTIYLIDQIGTVTTSSGNAIVKAEEMYASLSEADQALVTNYQTLTAARSAYNDLLASQHVFTFEDGNTTDENGYFKMAGSPSLKSGVAEKTYGGVTYTKALKVDSKPTITFTTVGTTTLTIITATTKTIKVDGVEQSTNSDNVIIVTLQAGNHTIVKGNGESHVYAIIVA